MAYELQEIEDKLLLKLGALVTSGLLLEVLPAWFDGELGLADLLKTYQPRMPSGFLSFPRNEEIDSDTKGANSIYNEYFATYTFGMVFTSFRGVGSDQFRERRQLYYRAKREFDLAITDRPVSGLTDFKARPIIKLRDYTLNRPEFLMTFHEFQVQAWDVAESL